MFLSATVWGLRHLSNHRLLCSSKGHKPTALSYHLINGSFPGNAKFPGSEGLGSCRFQIQTIRVRRSIVHLRTVQFPGIPRAWRSKGVKQGQSPGPGGEISAWQPLRCAMHIQGYALHTQARVGGNRWINMHIQERTQPQDGDKG
jgi:hypothetical protein